MDSKVLNSVQKAKTLPQYEESVSIIRECEELFKLQKRLSFLSRTDG